MSTTMAVYDEVLCLAAATALESQAQRQRKPVPAPIYDKTRQDKTRPDLTSPDLWPAFCLLCAVWGQALDPLPMPPHHSCPTQWRDLLEVFCQNAAPPFSHTPFAFQSKNVIVYTDRLGTDMRRRN